jgi:hypothetical protein
VKLLPGLVVIFGILYLLTGFRGWLVFFIGMLGLWLLAVLWINALEHSLSIERRIHLAWATVGESVPEELRVINKSRLPALWVEIVDEAETLDARSVWSPTLGQTPAADVTQCIFSSSAHTLGPTRPYQ